MRVCYLLLLCVCLAPAGSLLCPHSAHVYMSRYGEFCLTVNTLMKMLLQPHDIYVEIDSVTGHHIRFMSDYLYSGRIVGIEQNYSAFSYMAESLLQLPSKPILVSGHLQHIHKFNEQTEKVSVDSIQKILMDSGAPSMCPKVVKFSSSNGLLLRNSKIIRECKPTLYISNSFSMHSKDLIKMLISEGYEVFWHVSPAVRSEVISRASIPASDLQSLFVIDIVGVSLPDANDLYLKIAEVPDSNRVFIPYRPGMFLLKEYGVYFAYQEGVDPIGSEGKTVTEFSIVSGTRMQEINSTGGVKLLQIIQSDGDGGYTQEKHHFITQGCPYISIPARPSIAFDLPSDHSAFIAPNYSFPTPFSIHTDAYTTVNHDGFVLCKSEPFTECSLLFPPDLTSTGVSTYAEYYCSGLATALGSFLDQQQLEYRLTVCAVYLYELYVEVSATQRCSAFEGRSDPLLPEPFDVQYDPLICTEPLWCNHTQEFQWRLENWQNPSGDVNSGSEHQRAGCMGAKYLVFDPANEVNGLGEMLAEIAIMLRFAICNGRILHLTSQRFKSNRWAGPRWMHLFKKNSLFESYFRTLTSCRLKSSDLAGAEVVRDGLRLVAYPTRDSRVVIMRQLPSRGPCSACGSAWNGDRAFFSGLHIGELGYVLSSDGDNHVSDTGILDILDPHKREMGYFRAFMDEAFMPWMAQMVRYILRPRKWYSAHLKEVFQNRISPANLSFLQHRFASVYVQSQVPLWRYMHIISKKAPHIRHIFVFTESIDVLRNLTSDYPDYYFHYLHDALHNIDNINNVGSGHNFMLSMANLYIATEAEFFVGPLSSSWCATVNYMQRTRGDAGTDYHSVDMVSSYDVMMPECFIGTHFVS